MSQTENIQHMLVLTCEVSSDFLKLPCKLSIKLKLKLKLKFGNIRIRIFSQLLVLGLRLEFDNS